MKRHLLDSNAVSDYVFRRRGVFEKAEFARSQGSMIGTCHAVVAELLAGIEYSSSRDVNMDRVNRTLSRFRIWPLTLLVAREYARLYASMRRSGVTSKSSI